MPFCGILSSAANPAIPSHVAVCVATMSLGLPVLPPDVGALNDAPITPGSGSDDSDGPGLNPTGTVVRPGASDGSTPTTSDGFASSMIARRSKAGSGDESGCGVAPGFHAAIVASKNSIPFGRPMVTNESGVTPRSP